MESIKTLIVDDDPDTCRLLQTILQIEDYQTVTANEVDQGDVVALLDQERPDILILDYHLKSVESLSYLKEIRHHATWQKLAVIMMSAVDRKQECLAAGANGFILKPFDWQVITNIIKKVNNTIQKR